MTTHMSQSEARQIASKLLMENGLTSWSVTFDNAVKRAGQCSYTFRRISISRKLLAARTYEGSLDTIRHEVAHALTPGQHHNAIWSRKFRELGGNGQRCYSEETIVKPIAARWELRCTEHGVVGTRQRAPKDGARYGCRKCTASVRFDNCSWYEQGRKTSRNEPATRNFALAR